VLDMPLSINKFLLDTSIGGIIDTNQYRYPGLDTYAEFFKVGSIRGGKTIKDRITAVRVGQDSKSEVAVRFYSPDSAVGSRVLIAQAARKNVLLENSEDLTKKIATVLKSDLNLRNKVAQAIKADEKLKDKSPKDIIAGSDELKKLAAEADQTAQDLVKSLTDLNQNEILASQAEITANPNMALDKQVALLRSMMMSSITTFSSLKGLLEQQPFEQVKAELEKTTEQKELNAKLATLDLLALGQDTLMALADDVQIKLKSGESIPGTVVMGLLMEEKTLKTSYESLMYSVEELARYTRLLSPEYSF
ncbi:MAG TPA: hypothetical protein VN132_03130, partial [Bdellovibrio sp.]|nr:hypothetical protein [Bdellovibrio sp.]